MFAPILAAAMIAAATAACPTGQQERPSCFKACWSNKKGPCIREKDASVFNRRKLGCDDKDGNPWEGITKKGFMMLPMDDTGKGCYPPLYFDKNFNLSSSDMPATEFGYPPDPETCAESCRGRDGCKYFVHDGSDNRCWLNRVPTTGKFGCGKKDYKAYVLTGVARKPCGPVNMTCLDAEVTETPTTRAMSAAAQAAWARSQGGWVDDTVQTSGANCPKVGNSCGETIKSGARKGKWSATCCQECATCEKQTTGWNSGGGQCVAVKGCTKSTTIAPTTAGTTQPTTAPTTPSTTIPVEQRCFKADAFTSGKTGLAPSASDFEAAADSPAGSPAARASPQAAALAVSMAAAVQLVAGLL